MAAADGRRRLHLGVSLQGAGHHPAAWRVPGARPERLFTADHVVELVQTAERGTLDLVVLEDSFAPQPRHAHRVRGRLDALLTLARVAPRTTAIGLVPTVDVTHTEPFHVSKNVATLDLVSQGRAGWRIGLSTGAAEARLFGRKPAAPTAELVEEADDAAEVVARLWDSWDDDAVIRDRSTGRYVDREKLHYVDFEGRLFSVRGPSITPRPPQGQPVVVVDATTADETLTLAATRADVALVEAPDVTTATAARDTIRRRADAAGRPADEITVLAVVDVLLDADPATARRERDRLDRLDGGTPPAPGTVDFVGTPEGLVGLAQEWFAGGAVDGFLLRPARLPHDLDQVVDEVVPRLRDRGLFRRIYEGRTLRDHLGLARPASRYAATGGTNGQERR